MITLFYLLKDTIFIQTIIDGQVSPVSYFHVIETNLLVKIIMIFTTSLVLLILSFDILRHYLHQNSKKIFEPLVLVKISILTQLP